MAQTAQQAAEAEQRRRGLVGKPPEEWSDEDREAVEAAGVTEELEHIGVESGYGALTQRPFVHVTGLGDTQLRPEKAREVAFMLMDAASGAESDAVIIRWLMEKLEVAEESAAAMMHDLRIFRRRERERDLADPDTSGLSKRLAGTRSQPQRRRRGRR